VQQLAVGCEDGRIYILTVDLSATRGELLGAVYTSRHRRTDKLTTYSVCWSTGTRLAFDSAPWPAKARLSLHRGPVYSVDWNAFQFGLFASGGTDERLCLGSLLQVRLVRRIRCASMLIQVRVCSRLQCTPLSHRRVSCQGWRGLQPDP
jgi:hypothetical protein